MDGERASPLLQRGVIRMEVDRHRLLRLHIMDSRLTVHRQMVRLRMDHHRGIRGRRPGGEISLLHRRHRRIMGITRHLHLHQIVDHTIQVDRIIADLGTGAGPR